MEKVRKIAKKIVELPSYRSECNICAYSKFEEPCNEVDCKNYGLYKLMRGIK